VPVIVKAMQAHLDAVAVQENACLALRRLSDNDNAENQGVVAECGLQFIIKAMIQHESSVGVFAF